MKQLESYIKQGDCLELIKEIPDYSIDLVITDPPYTMTKRGKSCRPNYMRNNMGVNLFAAGGGGESIINPAIWMKECFRVLKDGTHFYTFCGINDVMNYLKAAVDAGFRLSNIITMIKDTKMPNRWYLKYSELILFFRKGRAKPINDMTSRDYIHVSMPKMKNGDKLHIAQKPLTLIEKMVYNSSATNEVVLDPFMGSGTTCVAAINLNRRYIGFELNPDYFDIAKRRIEDARNDIRESV